MAKELQIVGFRIGRETFGLPISLVHEIVRPPEITNVPHAPEYVEGVMNLRGRIVPVIDLRRRFGGAAIANSRKNRVLVVDVESRAVGLIVDSASEVLKISDAQIEPPPNVLTDAATSYVTGVAKHQGRLIILVDLKRILQSGELRLPAATGT
ncbi:MAG: chemotaxis protein CheW [Terriglobales bacterium]|jgi:purine-binding chemotaxis protein CheW